MDVQGMLLQRDESLAEAVKFPKFARIMDEVVTNVKYARSTGKLSRVAVRVSDSD